MRLEGRDGGPAPLVKQSQEKRLPLGEARLQLGARVAGVGHWSSILMAG